MLDRLETELIQDILELASQTWTPPDVFGPRRRGPLYSCSLVCRRLHTVAQQILWRDIAVIGALHVRRLEAAAAASPFEAIRKLYIDFRPTNDQDADLVLSILEQARTRSHQLEELALWGFAGAAFRVEMRRSWLQSISGCSKLKHLDVAGVNRFALPCGVVFSSVASLRIHHPERLPFNDLASITPNFFPSLQVLTLVLPRTREERMLELPVLHSALCAQLNLVYIDVLSFGSGTHIDFDPSASTRTVYNSRRTVDLKLFPLFGAHTLSLRHLSLVEDWISFHLLRRLIAEIPLSNLQTLFLPCHLPHDDRDRADKEDKLEQLLGVCEEEEVAVVRLQPGDRIRTQKAIERHDSIVQQTPPRPPAIPAVLPNELILAIIQRVAGKDVDDLRACCLASRKLYVYAQPRLWRVLILKEFYELDRLMSAITLGPSKDRLRRHPRTLIMWTWDSKDWPCATLFFLLRNLRSVTVHAVEGFGTDQLTALALLDGLEDLALEEIDMPSSATLPSFFFLPNLVTLSLDAVAASRGLLEYLLCLSFLPSLQALAVAGCTEPETDEAYFPCLPCGLLNQLDVLQLSSLELDSPYVESTILLHSVPKLVVLKPDVDDDNLAIPSTPHVAIGRFEDWEDEAGTLGILTTHLSSGASTLATIWLPPQVRPGSDNGGTTAKHGDAFFAACRKARVEVQWFSEGGPHLGQGGVLSGEFWRFAQEMKKAQPKEAKKAVVGQAGAA
ncbi:hypothetical protein JCM6882_006098 [Rhodosporidiobolus microsporus]